MSRDKELWAKMPKSVMVDAHLTGADRQVYSYIDYRAGKRGRWFGGQREIAQAIGISIRSVERAVARLSESGYLTKTRQGMRRLTVNEYEVLARLPTAIGSDMHGGTDPTLMTDPKTQTTDTDLDDDPLRGDELWRKMTTGFDPP